MILSEMEFNKLEMNLQFVGLDGYHMREVQEAQDPLAMVQMLVEASLAGSQPAWKDLVEVVDFKIENTITYNKHTRWVDHDASMHVTARQRLIQQPDKL